ncbi:MAG: hypothetical protein V3U14_06165 [candidate division NC10 bacterium]
MGTFYYNSVVLGLLLFPWSLVGLMVVGALRERRKVRAHARIR